MDGGAGDDVLGAAEGSADWTGAPGDSVGNTYNGGAGNDTLLGTNLSDTYLFNPGDGRDTLSDPADTGDADRIVLEGGVTWENVMFSRLGTTMRIQYGAMDSIDVSNWDIGASGPVQQIQVDDGIALLNAQVDLLVQAMATFGAEHNGISWEHP